MTTDGPRHAAESTTAGLRFGTPVRVDVAGLTHIGLVRPTNEDHFLIARVGRYFDTIATSLPEGDMPGHTEDTGHVIVVADGMGGHVAGEVASRLTIREMVRVALALPDWILHIDEATRGAALTRTEERVVKAHEAVLAESAREPGLSGMGSTVTGVLNLGRTLQLAHVGDSRAYLWRQGRLMRLTRDHTYVQMLVDAGAMSAEAAARSRQRHVLVNAVGGVNEDIRVDVDQVPLERGDRLLICSDGLSDPVHDNALAALLGAAGNAEQACRDLLALALDTGGRDNITVAVAIYDWD